MGFRTIFIESPCRLSYKSGYMVVRKEDDVAKIHLSEISSIMLQTMRVYISAYLMAELAKSKISLVYSDEKCNPIGQALPLYGAHNVSKRIQEQLAWGEPIKKTRVATCGEGEDPSAGGASCRSRSSGGSSTQGRRR